MSSIAHLYTNFSHLDENGDRPDLVPLERVEDQKLQSFEEGYQAGWTDAEINFSTEQKNITDEILHTIRDLAFTYQEAQAQINRSLHPMFEKIINSLLPSIAGTALRAHVVDQLLRITESQTKGKISIRVSEMDFPMLEDLLGGAKFELPVSLVADNTLQQHQLSISLGANECEVNLTAVCEEIIVAMQAFNFHSKLEYQDD